MQISPKIKQQLRLQNTFILILFLASITGLAWLSLQYQYEADWTNNKRNTPSDATIELLQKIQEPIKVNAFVSDSNKALISEIKHLIKNYQRYKNNITLEFINPLKETELVRELGIRNEGELQLVMGERSELVLAATELSLTNTLYRLSRSDEQWVLFLEGHDERSPYGDSSFDFSSWTKIMKSKGLRVRAYNLASNPNIPNNTSLLIIADPQKDFLPGEINILLNYIERGGNLLWLLEPKEILGLEPLAEALDIELLPGMVVDPNTQLLGINDTRFTLIPEYPQSPITNNFTSMTIFPTAKALEFYGADEWDAIDILETLPRTWSETEEYSAEITQEAGQDIPGPLVIGLSLTRVPSINEAEENMDIDAENFDEFEEDAIGFEPLQEQQRIVIIGDNDFASDAYIGQAGNLDFAMNVINWLIKDETFINIPNKTNSDLNFELTKTHQIIIGFGFLLIVPLLLLLTGIIIWYRRRKR